MSVSVDLLTKDERTASPPLPTSAASDDELREWARKHIERVRRLKRDIAVFVLGMVVLTPVWALVEWQDHGGFERLSGGGNPGDWEPWILYVALVWGLFVGIQALKTYFDRPTTEAEIEREVRRLKSDY